MTTEAAEKTVEQQVLEMITEHVERGLTLADACQQALDWLKREGLAEVLLGEVGGRMLAYVWRQENHALRGQAEGGVWTEPGAAKVDAKLLRAPVALMERLYQVGAVWKRLGDFTKADCLGTRDSYRGLASANGRRADIFDRLARKLKEDDQVRSKFTEASLKTIFAVIDDE